MDQHDKNIHEQKTLLEAFADHADLGVEGKTELTSWVETMRRRKPAFDREGLRRLVLSGQMPENLIKKLPMAAFNKQLLRNRYLHACIPAGAQWPPCFPLLLAVSLTQRTYVGEEVVYQLHDQPFNVFLVLEGTFACIARPSEMGGINEAPLAMTGSCQTSSSWASPFSPTLRRAMGAVHKDTSPKDLEGSYTIGLVTEFNPASLVFGTKTVQVTHVPVEDDKPPLSPYQLFGPTSYFGDFEVLGQTERRSSVRCETTVPKFQGWMEACGSSPGGAQAEALSEVTSAKDLPPPCRLAHPEALAKRSRRMIRMGLWPVASEVSKNNVESITWDTAFAWPPSSPADYTLDPSTTLSSGSLSEVDDEDFVPACHVKSLSLKNP
eukprot:CAMPEP_0170647140 /NCGR_PEP_ID=MMETSP0224-20130122/44029_1 /TAXON_ID=285029 /ORGANISM="Togula jolla, Strain CCCM 725" /LENGTH=379 /DNA_ID=CAMNT_0010978553 /DNA_START=164 /DNA_END=1300 /DNA_ORIENTATION=+